MVLAGNLVQCCCSVLSCLWVGGKLRSRGSTLVFYKHLVCFVDLVSQQREALLRSDRAGQPEWLKIHPSAHIWVAGGVHVTKSFTGQRSFWGLGMGRGAVETRH